MRFLVVVVVIFSSTQLLLLNHFSATAEERVGHRVFIKPSHEINGYDKKQQPRVSASQQSSEDRTLGGSAMPLASGNTQQQNGEINVSNGNGFRGYRDHVTLNGFDGSNGNANQGVVQMGFGSQSDGTVNWEMGNQREYQNSGTQVFVDNEYGNQQNGYSVSSSNNLAVEDQQTPAIWYDTVKPNANGPSEWPFQFEGGTANYQHQQQFFGNELNHQLNINDYNRQTDRQRPNTQYQQVRANQEPVSSAHHSSPSDGNIDHQGRPIGYSGSHQPTDSYDHIRGHGHSNRPHPQFPYRNHHSNANNPDDGYGRYKTLLDSYSHNQSPPPEDGDCNDYEHPEDHRPQYEYPSRPTGYRYRPKRPLTYELEEPRWDYYRDNDEYYIAKKRPQRPYHPRLRFRLPGRPSRNGVRVILPQVPRRYADYLGPEDYPYRYERQTYHFQH